MQPSQDVLLRSLSCQSRRRVQARRDKVRPGQPGQAKRAAGETKRGMAAQGEARRGARGRMLGHSGTGDHSLGPTGPTGDHSLGPTGPMGPTGPTGPAQRDQPNGTNGTSAPRSQNAPYPQAEPPAVLSRYSSQRSVTSTRPWTGLRSRSSRASYGRLPLLAAALPARTR
jgi:hypothetical protein